MRDIRAILERAAVIQRGLEEKKKEEARQIAIASFRENPEQFGTQLSHIMRPEGYQAFLQFMTGALPSDRTNLLQTPQTRNAWEALSRIGGDWYEYAPKLGKDARPMDAQEEAEFNKFIYLLEEFYYKGDFFQLTRHNSEINQKHDSLKDRFPTIGFDNTILAEFAFLINRLAKMRERNPRLATLDRPRLQKFIEDTGEYAHLQGYDTDDFYTESQDEVASRVEKQTPAFDMYFLKTSIIAEALIGHRLTYPDVVRMLDKLSKRKQELEREGYELQPKGSRYYANLSIDQDILSVDYVSSLRRPGTRLFNGSQFVHFDPETLPFHAVAMERLRKIRS